MRQTFFFGHAAKTLSTLLLASCAVAPGLANALDYPTRPVRLVVAYPPGGTTDTQARIVAQKLSERWNQQVIVDNKPGGNTVIATSQVKNSAPDGYTLLMTAMPFALNPLVMDSLPYDSKKDFAPVTLLTTVPGVFITHPGMNVKTVAEFIEKYKGSEEEPIPFGSAGTLTFTHLGGELFASQSGIKFQHVPYKGSSPAHQDLIAGRIKAMFDNGALEFIKTGRVVPLGVTSAKRLPWLPDVPTIAEQGFPDFQAAAWFGIFTRGGTPKEVVAKISEDITWAIRSPEVVEKLTASGVFAEGGTPEEFQQYLDAETDRWGAIIKEQDIKIQ
ncbi:tripartite tricarboxylate transporter substrate binding protein [Pusillimonas sp. SM2304]|uniref:Bug family tripartite tricarboxylate transporter substrate binding protein n=1 Tax=Pusillimonas sp. SM2304 TaxID=3073241 RepID=UPI0028740444|nr:tripartite tricarboxylate transporter substrate binding protein [Pusillimonas sp. SM2304]MDS1139064.1 tripartite tricarboxylate transporter substrate binding protein [Pusillimonas sp. SM2304]